MDTLTSITELLVGLACLGLAIATWRRPGRGRVVSGALGVAGAAAVANAVVSLAQ
ncbi:MAG: hypothetical protein WD096_06035 [Actinomycetota bacterium]